MNIDYPFQYTHTEIPPRCRKPRPVRHDDVMPVRIRRIQPSQAPVAIVEYGHRTNRDQDWVPFRRTYRWFQGRLFAPLTNNDGTPQPLDLPIAGVPDRSGHRPRNERVAEIRRWARQHLIIRGRIWHQVGEPRYVIQTFGLGGGRPGGTSLLTDHGYNSNIRRSMYYRIDHVQAAIKEAERIARARGDTDDIPIRPSTRYRVLLPVALRLNPRRQHSDGDPFLNQTEQIIQGTKNPAASGALILALALSKP